MTLRVAVRRWIRQPVMANFFESFPVKHQRGESDETHR